ncbi:MAG TPA: CoA-binding protein [candidate division Zixibacteria bacterium]
MPEEKKYLNPSSKGIDEILDSNKIVAVVGLSSNSARPSYCVADYLKSKGYTIIPVNPKEKEVLGEKAYPTLKEIPQKVDIVDIFRQPELVLPIIDDAIAVGAKVIWMQEGVINHQAALKASKHGLKVVMDRCILKEVRRRLNR